MKKLLMAFALAALATFSISCATESTATTRIAADGTEITTTTDANGVKTETRVFRDNPRVSKVVVTTYPDNRRVVRVYSARGEEKEVDSVADALEATGDELADAAGFVADKSKDVGSETADKAEDVKDKTVSTSKTVGEKTVEGAKTVGEKSAEGAKKVGDKTVEGAKKAGKAVKKVIP